MTDGARRNGRPIQAADAWIALGVPLLTNNRGDFSGVNDLRLVPDQPT